MYSDTIKEGPHLNLSCIQSQAVLYAGKIGKDS
jgi:hypothetical protein